MHSEILPSLPPFPEIRRLCQRITRVVPEIALGTHRVVIHDIRPHSIVVGHQVKEHEHSFYEGHLLLEGTARYAIGDGQMIGPGGALLHAPHTLHAWEEPLAPCLRLLVWFTMEPVVPVPRPLNWPVWPGILRDITDMLTEASDLLPGWHHRAAARLSVVISRLLTIANWPSSPQPAAAPEAQLMAVVDQFLRDNLSRALTLADIADHVGVSQRTLCRQYPELTGATVMEQLANLRMDRAAALLTDTDSSIAEIGTKVGMPEPSYFCRRFRQHFHVTPQAYRRQGGNNGKGTG